MRVLAYDPGATRAGWAVLDDFTYIASGVIRFPRGKIKFQVYRLMLEKEHTAKAVALLRQYKPGYVVTETVPSRGAGIPEQLYLASAQAAVVHTVAMEQGLEVRQISARTVQASIAKRKEGVKVTKPQVRNGVIERFPELQPRFKDWIKEFEEPDAIAIALHFTQSML